MGALPRLNMKAVVSDTERGGCLSVLAGTSGVTAPSLDADRMHRLVLAWVMFASIVGLAAPDTLPLGLRMVLLVGSVVTVVGYTRWLRKRYA